MITVASNKKQTTKPSAAATQMPDDDHQTFTMYIVGADGQETKVMTIEYTRKK